MLADASPVRRPGPREQNYLPGTRTSDTIASSSRHHITTGRDAMTDDRPTPNSPSSAAPPPRVGVIMGSRSDWNTMQHAADVLKELHIPYEVLVVSAHRTPDLLFTYADQAEKRGLEVIIAGAGGAAHLPGMCAAKTTLP